MSRNSPSPATLLVLLAAALMLMFGGAAGAAPFAVGGVQSTAADKCVVTGATHAALNGEFDVVVDAVNGNPANQNRVCKIDLAAVPEGNNTLSIALKSSLWGVLGAPVNFSFVRPTLGSLVVDSIQLKQ
jgi:hypothetical protein